MHSVTPKESTCRDPSHLIDSRDLGGLSSYLSCLFIYHPQILPRLFIVPQYGKTKKIAFFQIGLHFSLFGCSYLSFIIVTLEVPILSFLIFELCFYRGYFWSEPTDLQLSFLRPFFELKTNCLTADVLQLTEFVEDEFPY